MGKKSLRKGKRVEYCIRDIIRKVTSCERVPCSGNARILKGDLLLALNDKETLTVEVKARKNFKTLYSWMFPEKRKSPDLLVIKANRKEPLVIMTIDLFLKIISQIQD